MIRGLIDGCQGGGYTWKQEETPPEQLSPSIHPEYTDLFNQ